MLPGFDDVLTSLFRVLLSSRFNKVDFPTFELPRKVISGKFGFGMSLKLAADHAKRADEEKTFLARVACVGVYDCKPSHVRTVLPSDSFDTVICRSERALIESLCIVLGGSGVESC